MPRGRSNRPAAQWAHKHAGELISGVSRTTRREIRDLVTDAFQSGRGIRSLIKDIAATLGDDSRAETIARTETMRAANKGKLLDWEQAIEDGNLSENAMKVWIVADDEKLCPICEGLDGTEIPIDDEFDADGESIDGPPAHPNCRCTLAVTVPRGRR